MTPADDDGGRLRRALALGPAPGTGRASLGLVLALLASAAFFDGYDAQVMALLLPQIQDSFHVSVTALGIAHVPVALGQFAAFFVIRQADRVGRRPLLLLTILGYTAFTAATAAAWDLWSFAALQFCAQVFIGSEFAVAVTMLVELFPERKRGRALGVLLTFGPLGAVAVAVLLAAGGQNTPLGWRLFYLVGLLPLTAVAVVRRRLPETDSFQIEQRRRARGASRSEVPFLEPWLPRYRQRLVVVGLVSLLQTLPSSAAVAWWAFYAERQQGMSTGEVATYVIFAYGAGLLGYYCCGRLMDRIGRRPTAVIYIVCTVAAGAGLFQSGPGLASPVLLAVAVFFGLGVGPVLSAFATELFPARIRAQASAWVRNWFAIVGSALGPSLVGVLGDPYRGAIGNVGDTVSLLMVVALPAAFLVWRYMPEARGAALDAEAPLAVGLPGRGRLPAGDRAPAGTSLWRSFALGLGGALLLLGVVSGVVLAFGTGELRPSGAAQEWLFDMAGSTVPSGRHAALGQASKLGDAALARPLIPDGIAGKAAFSRIAVGRGRAGRNGVTATVPFTVARPAPSGVPPALSGVLVLHRSAGGWRVVAIGAVRRATAVPAPAGAGLPGPGLAWGAGAVAVVVTLAGAASLVVRRAGRATSSGP
ncbi:MAG: MFS transporter [Acidimicrobiales bacterium]